jgi:hypothetical protein
MMRPTMRQAKNQDLRATKGFHHGAKQRGTIQHKPAPAQETAAQIAPLPKQLPPAAA